MAAALDRRFLLVAWRRTQTRALSVGLAIVLLGQGRAFDDGGWLGWKSQKSRAVRFRDSLDGVVLPSIHVAEPECASPV